MSLEIVLAHLHVVGELFAQDVPGPPSRLAIGAEGDGAGGREGGVLVAFLVDGEVPDEEGAILDHLFAVFVGVRELLEALLHAEKVALVGARLEGDRAGSFEFESHFRGSFRTGYLGTCLTGWHAMCRVDCEPCCVREDAGVMMMVGERHRLPCCRASEPPPLKGLGGSSITVRDKFSIQTRTLQRLSPYLSVFVGFNRQTRTYPA